jgi:hypothetical protein
MDEPPRRVASTAENESTSNDGTCPAGAVAFLRATSVRRAASGDDRQPSAKHARAGDRHNSCRAGVAAPVSVLGYLADGLFGFSQVKALLSRKPAEQAGFETPEA